MTERQGSDPEWPESSSKFLAFIQKVMGTMEDADPHPGDTPQICSSRISADSSCAQRSSPHRLVHLFSRVHTGEGSRENQSSFCVFTAFFPPTLGITNYMNNKYVFRACQDLLAWNMMVQEDFLVKLPRLSPPVGIQTGHLYSKVHVTQEILGTSDFVVCWIGPQRGTSPNFLSLWICYLTQ